LRAFSIFQFERLFRYLQFDQLNLPLQITLLGIYRTGIVDKGGKLKSVLITASVFAFLAGNFDLIPYPRRPCAPSEG
jgi:hypothetical protein